MKQPRSINGLFCKEIVAPKSHFDPRSLRWKRSGRSWILLGCKRGAWNSKADRCRVGTSAHEILKPTRGSCPRGEKRIRKG